MRFSLFAKYFFSILLVVIASTLITRQIDESWRRKNFMQLMQQHIAQLVEKRAQIAAFMQEGNFLRVNQIFAQDPKLRGEIRILDAQERNFIHEKLQSTGNTNHTPVKERDQFNQALAIVFNENNIPRALHVETPAGAYQIILNPRLPIYRFTTLPQKQWWINFAIFLTITACICWICTRIFTRKVRFLERAVKKIALGDYQVEEKLLKLGNDEIGQLGKDIALMAQQLHEHAQNKKTMLSSISHELRSPLARMQVALSLLEDAPNAREKSIARIEEEIKRLNQLITTILHFQEVKSVPDMPEDLHLKSELFEISNDVRYEFQDREISIQLDCPSEISLHLDAGKFRSVVENILRNAVLHSQAQCLLEINVKEEEEHILLEFADNGSGVDEDALRSIFQPFFRLDPSRNRKTGGFGVGLSIVRGVVNFWSGTVEASNRQPPHTGLVISIRLPKGLKVCT